MFFYILGHFYFIFNFFSVTLSYFPYPKDKNNKDGITSIDFIIDNTNIEFN